jgi:transposase
VERRRRWSDEQKLAVLRETTEPGAIVSMVARRHGINTGLLYTWRKRLLQGAMSGFIPVDLTPAPSAPDPSNGAIRITGRTGLTVVIDRLVDRAALKLVLGVIEELGH